MSKSNAILVNIIFMQYVDQFWENVPKVAKTSIEIWLYFYF